ncbi:hypothetical protein [Azospirillum argentinense]
MGLWRGDAPGEDRRSLDRRKPSVGHKPAVAWGRRATYS